MNTRGRLAAIGLLTMLGIPAGAAISASSPDVFTSSAIVVLPANYHPSIHFVTAHGDTAEDALSAANAAVHRYLATAPHPSRLLEPASPPTSAPVLPLALCCLLGALVYALGATAATARRLPFGPARLG